jgi:hypothetical protein
MYIITKRHRGRAGRLEGIVDLAYK